MAGQDESFKSALGHFVKKTAQGNKALAARLLEVTRAEVHAYLKGRIPRADKLRRLEGVMSGIEGEGNVIAPAAGPASPAEGEAEKAFRLIRHLYNLLEAERSRVRS